jgi:hypothetical protein
MIKKILVCDECENEIKTSNMFLGVNFRYVNGIQNGIQELDIFVRYYIEPLFKDYEGYNFHICGIQCLMKFISKKLEKGEKND